MLPVCVQCDSGLWIASCLFGIATHRFEGSSFSVTSYVGNWGVGNLPVLVVCQGLSHEVKLAACLGVAIEKSTSPRL